VSRYLFTINTVADRARALRTVAAAPVGSRLEIKAAKRSLPQNDRFWSMLTDVAMQLKWHGHKLRPDDWKYLFLDALNMPLSVIGAARGMLPKINFPHEALVLAGIAQILVNFAVKATLVVAVLVTFRVPVQPTAVLAVIPLIGLLVLGIAVGVFLVPIGALFQDVVHALGVVASALVFLTPAAYTPPRVGLLGFITSWNPLTPLIMTARDLLVHGSSAQLPTTLMLVAASIVALLVSWVVFRLAMPILIERMGS